MPDWFSGAVPSILEKEVDGRVVHEPLTCWKEIKFDLFYSIDNPGKFSESDDDIELSLGNKRLNPRSILVCWPRLVYEFTAPQAKLAAHEVAAAKTPKPARSAPKSKPTKKRAKRLPSLRRRMIIAVLRRKFPGGFSDDDIP